MDRKPGKRRLTWFGNNRPGAPGAPNAPYPPLTRTPQKPNTLGKMWQREPRGHEDTDSWLVREPDAPDAPETPSPRRAGWEPASNLPVPPPTPEGTAFAARSASDERDDRLGGDAPTDEHAVPLWSQPDALADAPADARPDRPHGGRLRALWWKVAARFRRPRLVLAAVAGTLVLCSVLGVAALGNGFLHSEPNSAQGLWGAGGTTGVASPSAGQATPGATATATAASGNTQPPTTLTLAFTCASGVAGGTGQLCVHTLPYATLSLSVRYCDGSYAKGKAFHGTSTANGSGNYTWRWNVTTTCVGATTATVTAKSAGQTVTQSTTFTVTR